MNLSYQLKRYLPEITVVFIVGVMVLAATIFDDREVIFPEIAAISTGALLAPRYAWNVSKARIFGLLLLCGILGMGIVYFVPLSLTGKLIVAAFFSQIIYLFSATTFAPLVSAIMLPVLLDSRSIGYLISLVIFTSVILTASCMIERYGVRPRNMYLKQNGIRKADVIAAMLRIAAMAIVIAAAIRADLPFVVAPPLLVAFTEFCRPGTDIHREWRGNLILLIICAMLGASVRYLLSVYFGAPLTVSAIVAIVLFCGVMRVCKLHLPPAGAMVLLAMLIPEASIRTYPLQIAVGSSIYLIVSVVYAAVQSRMDRRSEEALLA